MVDVNPDEVSSAFAFAWKLRCAVINPTNSAVRSTLEPSKAPDRSEPKFDEPGSPILGRPDLAVATNVLSPSWFKPSVLGKFASRTLPSAFCEPFE